MSNYLKDGRSFARKYVWDKFKYAPVTLLGFLGAIVVPTGIAIADLSTIFQVFTLIPIGVIATSCWWYTIHNNEEYAKEGAVKYQKWYAEEQKKKLFEKFDTLNLGESENVLKIQLEKTYNSFLEALKNQTIISDTAYDQFTSQAEKVFESGVELLREISDILTVQKTINLEAVNQNNPELSNQKNDVYENNAQKISGLKLVFQDLIHAFEMSQLSLASATSHFESESEVTKIALGLTNSIKAAQKVQERLSRFSTDRDISETMTKYTRKEK